MENVFKLVRMAFNVIIFFIALTLLYMMFRQYDSLVRESAESISGDNLMYESVPLETNHYITKGDLISLLMDGLEYDVEIVDASGTYLIISKDYNPSSIDLYPITSEKFEKSYSYHLNGGITKIIFRYITG